MSCKFIAIRAASVDVYLNPGYSTDVLLLAVPPIIMKNLRMPLWRYDTLIPDHQFRF
jgi:hypothetical protein